MDELQDFDGLKDGDKSALARVFRNNRDACVHYYMKVYEISKDEALHLFTDALLVAASKLEADRTAVLKSKLSTMINNFARYVRLGQTRDEKRLKKQWESYQKVALLAPIGEETGEAEDFEAYLCSLERSVEALGEPCNTLIHERIWHSKSFKQIAQEFLEKLGLLQSKDYEELLRKKINALRTQMGDCIDKLR